MTTENPSETMATAIDTNMEDIDNTPFQLESEEAEDQNQFVLRFQFFASKQKTPPTERGHIATMTTKIVDSILYSNIDAKIIDSKGNNVDKQALINVPDEEIQNKFRIVTKPDARRQHELWVQVSTTTTFKNIKQQLMKFLIEEKIWMIHHIFGFHTMKTSRAGYIFRLNPATIYYDLF